MTKTAVEPESVEQTAGRLPSAVSDEQLIAMLVERARSEGFRLTGEGGLLQQLTKRVIEAALEGEITGHLGCSKRTRPGRTAATTATAPGPRPC